MTSAASSGAPEQGRKSAGTAAETIEHGGVELGDALRRELSQMNQVLDEYTRLFERNLGLKSALKLERRQNNLAANGGLHYAPSFR